MEISTEQDPRLGLASASSFERVYNCAGSPNAERGLPEESKPELTQSGTGIHDALHTGDEEALGVTEREIKNNLKAMEDAAVEKWLPSEGAAVTTNREERLWIRDDKLNAVASAQLDVFYIYSDKACLIDFKSGFKDQTPSERNWQLKVQAVALWQNNPQVTSIRVAIAHSRLTSTFDSCDYELTDILLAYREILHATWRADQPDAPRVPGDWCRWCKAKSLCRQFAVYNMIVTHNMPVVSGKPDDLAIINAVQTLTAPELGFVYSRKGSIEVLMEAAKQRLLSMPEEELKSVGYVKTDGVKRGTITNGAKAFHRLEAILTPDERVQCIKIDRTKAVELYSEHPVDGKHPSLKRAKEAVDAALGDVLEFKEGQPRLKAI